MTTTTPSIYKSMGGTLNILSMMSLFDVFLFRFCGCFHLVDVYLIRNNSRRPIKGKIFVNRYYSQSSFYGLKEKNNSKDTLFICRHKAQQRKRLNGRQEEGHWLAHFVCVAVPVFVCAELMSNVIFNNSTACHLIGFFLLLLSLYH